MAERFPSTTSKNTNSKNIPERLTGPGLSCREPSSPKRAQDNRQHFYPPQESAENTVLQTDLPSVHSHVQQQSNSKRENKKDFGTLQSQDFSLSNPNIGMDINIPVGEDSTGMSYDLQEGIDEVGEEVKETFSSLKLDENETGTQLRTMEPIIVQSFHKDSKKEDKKWRDEERKRRESEKRIKDEDRRTEQEAKRQQKAAEDKRRKDEKRKKPNKSTETNPESPLRFKDVLPAKVKNNQESKSINKVKIS